MNAPGAEWTCPMHPEIVRDAAGSCPICGMALEPRAATLESEPNPEYVDMRRRFWISIPLGLPGLFMLSRFVRWSEREPVFEVIEVPEGDPLSRSQLLTRGLFGGVAAFLFGALVIALLAALKEIRADPGASLDLAGRLVAALVPQGLAGWLQLISLLAFGVILGLLTAAVAAARRGAGRALATES